MNDSPQTPEVTVYIASADTVACTELTVRTAIRRAGMAHRLVVGDGGSSDGSRAMLERLRDCGWLQLEVAGRRDHADWLDEWLESCPTRWAVFVDSDVEFRRDDWLRDMVRAGERAGHALVCSELLPAASHSIEPVGHKEVYLAPRPAPWLLMVECSRIRALGVSFRFVAEASTARPEGLIAYDTGARLFAALTDAGLPWGQMPPEFRRRYTHFGNMSWGDRFGTGRAHRRKARRVKRRLRRARRSDKE